MKLSMDQLERLFSAENVASGAREVSFVGAAGGGLVDNQAGGNARVYYPGGSAPLDEASAEIMEAGPAGYLLTGGRRRQTRRRQKKQRGGKRRATGRRNGSGAFRLNLRAQIRMRSRSRY